MPEDYHSEIKKLLDKPVVLVGMMGSGKSHTGRALANALKLSFADSDKIIEEKAGLPVTEIFESFGEEKFRDAEHNTIIELLNSDTGVIATGGGALMNEKTLKALKSESIMIWLNADLETLWERVQKSQTRPLLQTENPKEKLQALMDERRALYSQAQIDVPIEASKQQNTLKTLIKSLYEHLNAVTL
ncbi:MAG: shikimate kinase [Pseudomonadota bacterium]